MRLASEAFILPSSFTSTAYLKASATVSSAAAHLSAYLASDALTLPSQFASPFLALASTLSLPPPAFVTVVSASVTVTTAVYLPGSVTIKLNSFVSESPVMTGVPSQYILNLQVYEPEPPETSTEQETSLPATA